MVRKRAKAILADSFRDLAGRKSVDRITIGEIAANCEYSPSTFYRSFKDKYDLIAWDYEEAARGIVSKVSIDGCSWSEAYLAAMELFQDQKTYFANLFRNTSGQDAFADLMADVNSGLYTEYIQSILGAAPGVRDLQLVRLYNLGLARTIGEWSIGQISLSARELSEISQMAFPRTLIHD